MRKRILLLSHKFSPDVGGIEINSEILAFAFHKEGHEVTVMTWTEGENLTKFPYKIIRKPDVLTLIKAHNWAEVVFENNPTLRLGWPAIFFNKPSVVALCIWVNRMSGEIAWQDRLKQLWLRRASAVIAVSHAVKQRCWPAATVIGNPYRDVFRILPEINRTNDFVFLGRLVSDKGADQAIEALSVLLSSEEYTKVSKDLSLTIIGDGPERQNLEKLARDMNVFDHIHFTGAMHGEELVKCLNSHEFMLVPSVWEEPFGNVALEGIACGCIPIVSDGGGLPDAIGDAGITYKRGKVGDLVNSMHKLLTNPDLQEQLRAKAHNHLKSHRSDVISKRYLQIIENT